MKAAARLAGGSNGRCSDIWAIAKGDSLKDALNLARRRRERLDRGESEGRKVVESAWRLLDVCTRAWELESRGSSDPTAGSDNYSPSFLSQYVHPPTGLPTDAQEAINIILDPFGSLGDANAEAEESFPSFQTEIACRIFVLLLECANAGKFEIASLFTQILMKVHDLPLIGFKAFVSVSQMK